MTEYYNPEENKWETINDGVIDEDEKLSREQGLKTALKILLGGKCVSCGNTNLNSLEIDHILALSAGGSYHPSNLQILCKECHRMKTRRERKVGRFD